MTKRLFADFGDKENTPKVNIDFSKVSIDKLGFSGGGLFGGMGQQDGGSVVFDAIMDEGPKEGDDQDILMSD